MAIAVITSFLQQSDSNGNPLNAGTITVYAGGTTTPLSLYSDSALSVGVTNPVTLDSSGRHAMTYIATAAYKILVKNSAGTTIYTRDNIDPGVAVGSGALPVANGGTASTTAAAARTALGAAAATDMATAQSDISNAQTWVGYLLTTMTRMAFGTTAQEPAATNYGFRRDTTTGFWRASNGSTWKNLLVQGQLLPADYATGTALVCVQRSRTTSTAATAIATTIPNDSSKPQISEGTEIFSVSFTPTSASSVLRFRALVKGANSTNAVANIVALFKNTDADSISATAVYQPAANNVVEILLTHEQSAAAASAATYSIRAAGNSATFTLNNAANTLGSLMMSEFIIEEWLAP